TNWRTNTGFTDLPALPFDYRKELISSMPSGCPARHGSHLPHGGSYRDLSRASARVRPERSSSGRTPDP
ncbi:hypothetical protein ACWDCZ_40560, partial [Kitasatospora sp. NPDC001225]